MKVAVGTTNKSKILAVRKAWTILGNAEIIGVKVRSGVPDQPKGIKQIVLGALNRAVEARLKTRSDYGVGIEAGYIMLGSLIMDLQVALIVDKENYVTMGFSPGFQVPPEVLRYNTLGEYMAVLTSRKSINEEIGAIGYLSRGLVTRTDLTHQAIIMALIPRLNKSLYEELIKIDRIMEWINEETL